MAIIKGEVLSKILESLIPAKIYHLMNQYFEYLSPSLYLNLLKYL